ncbi:response regulator [Pedobacter jejuensis]|uniref:DNA-binding response regulator n=1 Tax=Pedobacter jejuensis TaxID=1268550 RepID=A0A3N0BTJ0_9SPHI|nr:response regulator transcription factor [Pedobacter jejuensis]RNL52409.1 DNA-binding response regulator [Pedobacter jejuensis]
MKENLKILIADDNELMRLVMRGLFIKYLDNPSIKQTTNLDDTFECLSQERFDLLLLDINMPNGDSSPQTVVDIKAIYPELKIVMFSGNDKETLEPEYLAAGAIGFIQKNENMNTCTKEIIETVL